MKGRLVAMLLTLCSSLGGPILAGTPGVVDLRLGAAEVAQVPTHPSLAVLLEFPAPVTDYVGRGFTEDPGAVAGDFFLRWGNGDRYLAVSPLLEGARGVLHVVTAGRSYAITFFPASSDQAWAKVRFLDEAAEPALSAPQSPAPVPVKRTLLPPAPLPRPAARVEKWLGAVDLLRLAERMSPAQRTALVRANPALSYRALGGANEVAGGRLHLRSALRNDILDTLAIGFTLENTGDRPRRWDPSTLRVRVGDMVLEPVLSTLEPLVPARTRVEHVLVLAGDGQGGRHRWSVDNDFRLSLAESEPEDARARPAP